MGFQRYVAFICSVATKVTESHFNFSTKESIICTALAHGKGTFTDPSSKANHRKKNGTG
jgi:hypothetical protein